MDSPPNVPVKKKKKKRKRTEEERNVECPDCDKKFFWNSQMQHHRLVHTGEKPHVCQICGKAFNTTYSLKTHNFIHTNEKPYKCSFCAYACRDVSTLRKHEHRHMGIVNTFQCTLCSQTFKEKSRLKMHVAEKHLNIDLKQHSCDECGGRYKSKSQLTQHIKLVHRRLAAGHCPVCGVYIPNVYNLPTHLDSHVRARPYACAVEGCGRAYKDQSSLKKHMVIHNPDLHFPCEICNRLFTRKARLARHLVAVHGKRRRVQCDYCGLKFYSKAYLINHIGRKHSKKRKKYICDICGLKTYNKPSIVMHIKHGHGNENDRECKICHTIYKKYIYLKHHYKYTHNIAYKTKTRPKLVIKDEPLDDNFDARSIDLFEIEKEEPPESNPGPEGSQTPNPEPPSELDLQTVVECERLNENDFEQFYVKNVTRISTGYKEKSKSKRENIGKVDEKALEEVKKLKQKFIEDGRKKDVARALENARVIYNERMRAFLNDSLTKTDPLKVKFFKKPKKTKEVYKTSPKTKTSVDINDIKSYQSDNLDVNINENVPNDDIDVKTCGNIEDDVENKVDVKEISDQIDKNTSIGDEKTYQTDGDSDLDKPLILRRKKTHRNRKSRRHPRNKNDSKNYANDSNDEEYHNDDDDDWNKPLKTTHKVNFNSHQCYICFKLYQTKEELLNHCKDHFDVCNDRFLKKCPLCPYVTKVNIRRHLKLKHGINVKIPYSRIQDKKDNTNGCRYYFEINDKLINKMEVIPSVKNLNKMASMRIEQKAREDKDKALKKTKLVRKGTEWIVQTEKVNISKDMIIPKFDSDAFKDIDPKVSDKDSYFDSLKKMYQLAKKSGKTMLFPCQHCDKICQNFAALKLHSRKHETNPKPFKKKVWKHKLKNQAKGKQNTKKPKVNDSNRTAKPKPIMNKHKCAPELKEFYKNNITGGDIEFWQFLKIFNKMTRENISDFKDIEGKIEYGIDTVNTDENNTIKEDNADSKNLINDIVNKKSPDKNPAKVNKHKNIKSKQKNSYKRVVRISKVDYVKRNLEKQKLREKIASRSSS